MPYCSDCVKKGCRFGTLEKPPKECPTVGATSEESIGRYTEEELRNARWAAIAEAESWDEKYTRVEDIMNYAYLCGYHRLGVAFCSGFTKEAATLVKILRKNGFEVHSAMCKNESCSKDHLDVPADKRIHPGEYEPMCNPAGQAHALDKAGCQLNIVLGLCVGHDTLFFKHSEAPVTVLASKDRALGHNPIMALYTADSYYPRVYDFIKNRYGRKDEE